jgi:tetratricopeptide (TPR) repeat protein
MRFVPAILFWVALHVGWCLVSVVQAQAVSGSSGPRESDGAAGLLDRHEQVPQPPALISPWLYGGSGWGYYPYSVRLGSGELDSFHRWGRATERYRQNAFELRRKLEQRRRYTYHGGEARRYWPMEDSTDLPGAGALPGGRRWYRYYVAPALSEIYDQGRELEYYRQQELYLREQLTLLTHRDLLNRGLEQFRAGAYGQAARLFVAAADKNREDAASRLHAAQALLAVGMYDQALTHVRRAFELQPLLMQLPLDLANDYGRKADYEEHLAALEAHVRDDPTDADAAVLLAYARFFSARPQDAAEALRRIKPLARKDPFVAKLLSAAGPLVPAAR